MTVTLTMKNGSVRVVCDASGQWWVELGEGLIALDRRESFLPLLPLLEESPRTITTESGTPFPIEDLVLHALHFGSSYWKDLALTWVESLDIWSDEMDEQVRRLTVRGSKWPQRLRHRAANLCKKRGPAT